MSRASTTVRRIRRRLAPRSRVALARWRLRGRPLPPPHAAKRRLVAETARRHGLRHLVETGTYLGEMVAGVRANFETIVSIELDPELCRAARARFAGDPGVRILEGDSSLLLPGVVSQLDGPALFWLDGHYSEGVTALGEEPCPVIGELEAILTRPQPDVVLIDDARLFGAAGWPSLGRVRRHAERLRPGLEWTIADDVIRLIPPS